MNPKLLYGPLHRTIIYLGPAYVQLYKHRFRQDYLCRKLTVSSEKLGEHIKPLDWAHPIFRETSLAHYRETMQKQKFRPFDARGLGRRIFFEGSTRSLYIDVSYYHSKPPSIIFHRVYGLLWSIKLQYYVPMHLDPTRHLYSGYMQMKGSLEGGGFGWLKNIVASSGDPVVQALAVVDRSELRRQVDRVGEVSPEHMVTLWTTLHEHIYRLLLAETLDVVGLFEAITGKDYLEEKKLKPLEIFNESPFIAGLIEYLTHLKL